MLLFRGPERDHRVQVRKPGRRAFHLGDENRRVLEREAFARPFLEARSCLRTALCVKGAQDLDRRRRIGGRGGDADLLKSAATLVQIKCGTPSLTSMIPCDQVETFRIAFCT